MDNKFYLPILKSKLGEFIALSKLNETQRSLITPLFEVTPLEWDHSERKKPREINEHLDSFCKKFATKWGHFNSFIDTSLMNWEGVDSSPKIEYIFDKLKDLKLSPLPVISLNSTPAFLMAFKRILTKHSINEIAFRVNPNVVTNANFETNIFELFNQIELTPKNTHLIFDLVEPNFSEPEEFAESIVATLEEFPFLSQWKSFTIAGTSFPSSSAIKEGIWSFSRNEWTFYKALITKINSTEYNRDINYGDYSIVNPTYFDFNPKIMSASANIRYTHDDKWIVAKGKALKSKSAYLQYITLAGNIVTSKYFLGERFSDGDYHLAKCFRKEEGPGAPSIWMWVGNNHHFTKVLQDLFSIPAES